MSSKRPARLLLTSLALAGAVSLTSCAAFNRGQFVLSRNVTLGQELEDLNVARHNGAITDAEYEVLKAKVIEVYDMDPGDWLDDSDWDHDHDHGDHH